MDSPSVNPQGYTPPAYQQLPTSTRPWEVGPIAGSPFPSPTFPAGSYIDGYGSLITPSSVVRTIGGLGN
jgi:hypothetical protein